ncbi:MAG TPA: ABC transporter substrate-binding protein [Anaeromyxobacteraceae bacterium]|nr:ABC transporter substrate-binding protein [Anaeromyxobacteraceae bacterium]
MRRSPLLAAALLAGACSPSRPPLPEVRVHATVSEAGLRALASAARARNVAALVQVAGGPAGADLAWFGEPGEAVLAQVNLVAGVAPPQPEVDPRWKDPAGRFVPLAARARVLVRDPRAELPVEPARLRDLADPRLAGRQALPSFGQGLGPTTAAAFSLVHGDRAVLGLLEAVARNRPHLAASDDEVRVLVAGGAAGFGLTGSEEAAAGAASAAALEVIYPDQQGSGCVVLPTAAALTRNGASSAPARALLAWMAGPEAERILVARAPGYMPLRGDVPVPPGVRPASNVRSLRLDWDALAQAARRLQPLLDGWPRP